MNYEDFCAVCGWSEDSQKAKAAYESYLNSLEFADLI